MVYRDTSQPITAREMMAVHGYVVSAPKIDLSRSRKLWTMVAMVAIGDEQGEEETVEIPETRVCSLRTSYKVALDRRSYVAL